jgi:hypothetical protein
VTGAAVADYVEAVCVDRGLDPRSTPLRAVLSWIRYREAFDSREQNNVAAALGGHGDDARQRATRW